MLAPGEHLYILFLHSERVARYGEIENVSFEIIFCHAPWRKFLHSWSIVREVRFHRGLPHKSISLSFIKYHPLEADSGGIPLLPLWEVGGGPLPLPSSHGLSLVNLMICICGIPFKT